MKRPAFTLLEVLAALVLSAVLMFGVMAVVASPRNRNLAAVVAVDPMAPGDDTLDRLADLLREDLMLARSVEAGADRLTLDGPLALDDASRERSHRPARVVYAVEKDANGAWLVRTQSAQDVLSTGIVRRDLVTRGVRRLAVSSADGQTPAGQPTRTWRLSVWTTDAEQPDVDRVLATVSRGAQ